MKTGPRYDFVPDAAQIAFARSLLIAEDAHMLVLNKPSGLSAQGGRGGAVTLDHLLAAFAKSNGRRPELVHRLDRDTSGVILAARTKPAAGFFGKALMARRFRKTYWAMVERAPEPATGVIDATLRREEIGREAYMRVSPPDHPDAQAAESRYRTLAESVDGALVELEPVTGRMHQLRVHLASIARPIAGDARYGGTLRLGGGAVPRLMLHARALTFPHPDGGTRTLEAEAPEDFEAVAARCGLTLPAYCNGGSL